MEKNVMDDIYMQSLLFDFYGELLTDHQKEIYGDYVLNDYSLGEIAKDHGITRQGVHDLIKRCNQSLLNYENKLKLVQRFTNAKKKVNHLHHIALNIKEAHDKDQSCASSRVIHQIHEIDRIAQDILEDF